MYQRFETRRSRLVPEGHENEVGALLKHEDDLHFDLRRLCSLEAIDEHILPEKTAGWVSVWAFGFDLFPKFD